MSVSVVISTRGRPDSLHRTLRALGRQTRPPEEVWVVDASDGNAGRPREERPAEDGLLAHTLVRAEAGVCAQRNVGIGLASGSWVLLCDDDIEPDPDYLERLVRHTDAHPDCGAVTGAIIEPSSDGGFAAPFPPPSLRHLLFGFVFQTSVYGDPAPGRFGSALRPLARQLAAWYRRRGNRWSLAGWPLLTQLDGDPVRAATYGLGAALIRRDWLLQAPFDEALGPHGIGDNYGVALSLPGDRPIHVLTDVTVRHHRAAAGRLPTADVVRLRAHALDRFMALDARFGRAHRAALVWSLVGQAALLAVKGRREAAATLRAGLEVGLGRNPLRADDAGRQPTSSARTSAPHAP